MVAIAVGSIFLFNSQKLQATEGQTAAASAKIELTSMEKAYGVAARIGLAGPRPDWAFSQAPSAPIPPPIPEDVEVQHIPGSPVALTLGRTKNRYFPPDWWPNDHPPMPEVVQHGRKADGLFGCSYCHLSNGFGRPENAPVAGHSVEYFVSQMKAFKEGTRGGSRMPAIAKLATDAEVLAAAQYFAAIAPKTWIDVKETAQVPRTKVVGGLHIVLEPQEMEPMGARIIEVAKDIHRTELRDSRSPFIAYAPVGSIAKGKAIVESLDDPAKACAACHGPDLRGVGPFPGISGRSPTYTVRELWNFQSSDRRGGNSVLMEPIVANMRLDDMIAVAAYLGTLAP